MINSYSKNKIRLETILTAPENKIRLEVILTAIRGFYKRRDGVRWLVCGTMILFFYYFYLPVFAEYRASVLLGAEIVRTDFLEIRCRGVCLEPDDMSIYGQEWRDSREWRSIYETVPEETLLKVCCPRYSYSSAAGIPNPLTPEDIEDNRYNL